MATELATRAGSSLMVPPDKNAFEAYGESGGSRIIGEMLKFNKGEWVHGRDNLEMKEGTKLIAGVNLVEVGWIMWQEGRPTDVVMGRIGDGFLPPRRAELGFLNTLEWPRSEQDSDYGKPRDPWQKASAMPLVDQAGQVYTFVTGSKGGEGALKELAKVFGKRVRQHPDEVPIVTLQMSSYRHSNKQLGKIWVPVFQIVGWTAAKRLEKALAKAETMAEQEAEAGLEDEQQAPARPKASPHKDYQAERPSRKPAAAKPAPAETAYAGEDDDIPF